MKKLLPLLLLLALPACNTTVSDRCQAYSAAYSLYQATVAVRQVSPEEASAAQIAAVALTLRCGWIQTRALDSNRVSIVLPPKR